MKYSLKDAMQAAIGAFSSILLFYVLRETPGPWFDYRVGIGITVAWSYILYLSFIKKNHVSPIFFFFDLIIVIFISGYLSILFNLATYQQIAGLSFFGSPAIVGVWMGLPFALLFDKMNINSVLARYYVSKKQ